MRRGGVGVAFAPKTVGAGDASLCVRDGRPTRTPRPRNGGAMNTNLGARALARACALLVAVAAVLLMPARGNAGVIGWFEPDPCTPGTVFDTYYTAGTASFTCDAGRLRIT